MYSEIKVQKKESGPNLDPVEKLRVRISALRLSLSTSRKAFIGQNWGYIRNNCGYERVSRSLQARED